MAQVTMEGTEYAALLAYERQYKQLHVELLKSHIVDFSEEKFEHFWEAGKAEDVKWPEFMIGDVARSYAAQFMHLDNETQKKLVKMDCHYFRMEAGGFRSYGGIDFLTYELNVAKYWDNLAKAIREEEAAAKEAVKEAKEEANE